jgi:hypothetical protein
MVVLVLACGLLASMNAPAFAQTPPAKSKTRPDKASPPPAPAPKAADKAGAPAAPKPGPEVKALGYFAGRWTSESELKPGPLGPGGKMTGTDKCQWFAGGFQLVCRSEGNGAMGPMTSMGIMSYNVADKAYSYYGIDSMGTAEISTGSKKGNTWSFSANSTVNGQAFRSRYTVVESSPTSYTFKWETSPDGSKWSTLMEGTSTKAAAKSTK